MKNILISTDFSKNAEQAFIYALNIAQATKGKLFLANIHDIPTTFDYPHVYDFNKVESVIHKEVETNFKKLLKRYHAKERLESDIEFCVMENRSVVKGINTLVTMHQIDLLVVGIKGASRAREILMGSTSKALIKKSLCPVLLIPENASKPNFDSILFASDFQGKDIEALNQLIDLFAIYNPEITISHIGTKRESHPDQSFKSFKHWIQKNVDYEKLNFQPLLANDIYDRLNSYINDQKFNLLAIVEKEQDDFVSRLFHKDLIKKMDFHTTVPMLVLNEHYLH